MWLQRDFEFSGTTWIMTSPGVSSQVALDSEKVHAMMKPTALFAQKNDCC
jgi:hypothetical protein